MNNWVDLEHRLWQQLEQNSLQETPILVGFSGGVDSLALLWGLLRVKKKNLSACFVHHGPGVNREYRDQALAFCQSFCSQHGVSFYTERQEGSELRSEEELRNFRYGVFARVQGKINNSILALGHHRDDLLETRLMRLIRGVGPQGLVGMNVYHGGIFRPFLKASKAELSQYLEGFQIAPLQDPSNSSMDPFRNWLRMQWLPQLESRQAGAVNALARSLDVLVDLGGVNNDFGLFIRDRAILRPEYLSLSKSEQKSLLAGFLLKNNIRNFTQAQIEEIIKRLDNSQKVFTFRVAGCLWSINAEQIQVQELV